MASHSPSSPSPPNSPPASLLIETVDPRTGDALAQPVHQPARDPPAAASTLTSSLSDRLDRLHIPYDLDTVSQSGQPVEETPHSLHHAATGAITDRIDIPHNPNTLLQPARRQRIGHLPAAILPTLAADDHEQHPFGILNSIHFRLRIGRDTSGNPNMMPPAPPARVVQRNDFNWPIPNGDPKDNVTSTTSTSPRTSTRTSTIATPVQGAIREDQGADNFLGNAMKPSFPPKLEGVAGARQKSEAKVTEDLAGLGPELEAALLAKREYNDKFGAFRTRWSEVQFALAARADEVRGEATAAELRSLVGAIGVMFALGKAVDLAAYPGWGFGEFDERACSPLGYLSELFPELIRRRPAGPADPLGEAEEVPAPVLPLQWDFSLSGIMGEEQDRPRDLWAAAAAGQWEAVDEMTSGVLAEAEKLLGRV